MVPAIESDRAGRPWVELWGDWLHRVDVPERAFALPLGDMGSVYHLHYFNLGRDFFCPPVYGGRDSSSSSLLCDPFSLFSAFNLPACLKIQQSLLVRLAGLSGGAMDLAWTIEYAVQAGWAWIVSFIWLLLLAGLGATESGVDHRVIGIVTVASTLVLVVSGLAVAVWSRRCQPRLPCFCYGLANYPRPRKNGS